MFNKVHFISNPRDGFDMEVFFECLEASGARFSRFAQRLCLDLEGRMQFDGYGVHRTSTSDIIRRELRESDGLIFEIELVARLVVRHERFSEYSRIEFCISAHDLDALSVVPRKALLDRIYMWALKMKVPYVLRLDTLFRTIRRYWRFEEDTPIIRFEKFDQINTSAFELLIAGEFGGKKVRGENLDISSLGVADIAPYEQFHGEAAPPGDARNRLPADAVLEENEWWENESKIEAWLDAVEARKDIVPRWAREVRTSLPGVEQDFAETIEEVIEPILPSTLSIEQWKTMKQTRGDLLTDQQLESLFPSIESEKAGAMNAYSSLVEPEDEAFNGTYFVFWDRVSMKISESERLSRVLEIPKYLDNVVEPLGISMRINYHNGDWEGLNRPERYVVARVANLSEHVALIPFDEALIPFDEETLSAESIQRTLEAALRLPPPEGMTCRPFWSEIDFQCVRIAIHAPDAFQVYKVYVKGESKGLTFPLIHTPSGFKLDAPDFNTRFMPPIHMKAERFQDIVSVRIQLNWSPWRTKGAPEYDALKKAVLELCDTGWRLDDSTHGLFQPD